MGPRCWSITWLASPDRYLTSQWPHAKLTAILADTLLVTQWTPNWPHLSPPSIINTKSFVRHYQSDFSSLQVHCYFNFNMSRASPAFQLLQSMPCCYEVPPTLWRPNSFFRVWRAPYGPTLAPTHQTPVNTSRCGMSIVKWSICHC